MTDIIICNNVAPNPGIDTWVQYILPQDTDEILFERWVVGRPENLYNNKFQNVPRYNSPGVGFFKSNDANFLNYIC